MSSLARKHYFGFAGGAALLLLALWLYLSTRPVQIGEFVMPKLAGWTCTVTRTRTTHRAEYERDEGNNKMFVSFVWRLDRAGNAPKTTQALAAEAAQTFPQSAQIMQAGGVNFRVGSTQQKTIQAMPAIETSTLTTSSSETTYGRAIDFVNGPQLYIIDATVVVPAPSASTPPADLAAQRDEAVDTVIQSLTPTS